MLSLHRVAVIVSLGLFGALGLAGDRPQAAPVSYVLIIDEIRDLGTLPGHASSEAHAINENGSIAGTSQTSAGVSRAVYWPFPIVPFSLSHLGGGWSEAWGINDAGVVVGNSRSSENDDSHGFRWTQANGMSDLGIIGTTVGGLKPVKFVRVSDINNNGTIVGAIGSEFGTSGFLLFAGGTLLAPLPFCANGVLTATVTAINDYDQFTGNVFCESGPWGVPYSAWLLATTLLGGNESGSDSGYAVNAKNVVVGSISGPPELHAFRWSSSAGQQDIHPPDDAAYASVARGINDHGLVVGHKYTNDKSRAFVYTPGLKMKTLPGLCGWGSWTSDSDAYAVNNAGWVVGKSKTCAGDWHATLWKVRVVVRGYIDFP